MSKECRSLARLVLTSLAVGAIASTAVVMGSGVAKAHVIPTPCDFSTGGGYVISDNGYNGNFGLVGGCKHGGFYGHVNFVDHDASGDFAGLHLSSDSIDGYFEPAAGSNVRDICGLADTNLFGKVRFRARIEDNGTPGTGVDKFGLKLTLMPSGIPILLMTTRVLAGGNIDLHKPNPSTTGPDVPPDEIAVCGSDDTGLGM